MLAVSPQASEAIRAIVASAETPEGAVLRIASEPDAGLQIALVESPEPEDVVVEEEGGALAIEATTAKLLDDKRLDASFEGEAGVTFTVSEQPGLNGRPPHSEPPPA